MIKKQKSIQREREEFLKQTMSHLSATIRSKDGASLKPDAEELSKPATTLAHSEEVKEPYFSLVFKFCLSY